MTTTNIYTIKKGEKYPIEITLTSKNEFGERTPLDLTNSCIRFQIKDELKDDYYIVNKFISTETDVYTDGRIVDPVNGKIIVRFTDDDYERLVEERVYYLVIRWEIEDQDFSKIVSANGDSCLMFKVCYP